MIRQAIGKLHDLVVAQPCQRVAGAAVEFQLVVAAGQRAVIAGGDHFGGQRGLALVADIVEHQRHRFVEKIHAQIAIQVLTQFVLLVDGAGNAHRHAAQGILRSW